MKKIIYLSSIILLGGNSLFGQTNFFKEITPGDITEVREVTKQVKNKSIFRLNEQALFNYLLSAPMELTSNGATLPLEIPLPNGKTETFGIVESPILSPQVAAQNPEIKTYSGNGLTNKETSIRLSMTSSGFSAILLNVDGDAVYFEKYSNSQPDVYFNYFSQDAIFPKGYDRSNHCGVDATNDRQRFLPGLPITNRNTNNTGATRTTYRLAMAADAEFVAAHGGTQASGLAAVVVYVNNMIAVYLKELSVSFTLVSGTNLIYTNAVTDPYTNANQILMLAENQTNCDAVIGNGNYDIGHVWGLEGGSGGGVATFESLCNNAAKARGVSGEGGVPFAQVFFDQLLFHEIGHQFGMSHSYNSSLPVCTTRNPPTSVEPGAGATIMSYGFTCGTDDYFTSTTTGPILVFHTINYSEAVAYMATIPGCGTTVATGNDPPVVTMPGAFTIPRSTPFALTGSATDPNADPLTYCWEGTDIGLIVPDATTLANTAEPPFFRTYDPAAAASTRNFPILARILDGTNFAKGDKLPSVGIVTTHRLTARDNRAIGGGVSFGTVNITVDGAIGPFLETTNLTGNFNGFSTQTITWSVNGTNAATPNVKISLSTDGGSTFPAILLASTPNDGTQAVTLPNTPTSTGRIKVEAVGNIFFDISNADFTILLVLPVHLLSFNARLKGNNDALLTWETASETKTKGYEIEMTDGSLAYRKIGFVVGKGTTSFTSNYEFVVPGLKPGVYYFRLKIVDIDGHITYSEVRTLKIVNENDLVRIYPNPSQDGWFRLEAADLSSKKISIEITNAIGQLIRTSSFVNYSRPLFIKIPAGPGVYNLRITINDGITVFKKIISLK